MSDVVSAELRDLLGPVRQVGYIVADVEASARAWVDRLGVGPWRIQHGVTFDECTYDGRSIDIEVSIAIDITQGD